MTHLPCLFLIFCWISSSTSIMVSFGTNQGPIVPRPSTTAQPPNYNAKPAPVFERIDDTPNPSTYKPPVPHQYRSKLYSYKPQPNLILGTPLDIKYTPGLSKYDIYKRKQARSLGFDYKGPQFFERQPYEFDYEKQQLYRAKYYKQARVDQGQLQGSQGPQELQGLQGLQGQQGQQGPQHPQYPQGQYQQHQVKVVPQIGVIYSSGVRYYVPQLVYVDESAENSVYDQNDVKYY